MMKLFKVLALLIICTINIIAFNASAHLSAVITAAGTGGDPSDQFGFSGIVRSAGVTATALFGHDATGGPYTLTISGNIATFNGANNTKAPFSSATGTGKVGVGDIIEYTQSGTKHAVIKGIAVDANGAKAYVWSPALTTSAVDSSTVTATTANDTFHVYRAYVGGERGSQLDFTGAGHSYTGDTSKDLTDSDVQKIYHLALYADGADTGYLNDRNWTTSSSYYIHIFTPVSSSMVSLSQRHSGVWDTSKYYLANTDGDLNAKMWQDYARWEGLQFLNTGLTTDRGAIFANDYNSNGYLRDTIIRGNGYASAYVQHGIDSYAGGNFINVIVYDIPKITGSRTFNSDGSNWRLMNCLFIGGYYSTRRAGGGGGGYNNYFHNCGAGAGECWYNGFTVGSNNATSETYFDIDNVAYTTSNFTDVTAGSENFTLPAGSELINVGTDLSGQTFPLNYAYDITGHRRDTWDVGPFKYIPSAIIYSENFDGTKSCGSGQVSTCQNTYTTCDGWGVFQATGIEGTYSYSATTWACISPTAWAAKSPFYAFFKFNQTRVDATESCLLHFNIETSDYLRLVNYDQSETTYKIRIRDEAGEGGFSNTLNYGTTYNVWIERTKASGGGNNGTVKIFTSTGSKPETPDGSSSVLSSTNGVTNINYGCGSGGVSNTRRFDHVVVSSEQITGIP